MSDACRPGRFHACAFFFSYQDHFYQRNLIFFLISMYITCFFVTGYLVWTEKRCCWFGFFFVKLPIKKILWKKNIWSQVIYYPPAEVSHRGEGLICWGGYRRNVGASDDALPVPQHQRPADHCNHRKNIKYISFSQHIADVFLNSILVLIIRRQIECVLPCLCVCVCVYLWTLQWAGCCCRWRPVSGWGSRYPVWRRSLPPHSSEEFAVSSWSSETRRRKFNP